MLGVRRVGQSIALVLAIVLLNVVLFVRITGTEHTEPALLLVHSRNSLASSLAVWGEEFADACDRAPGARDAETALLSAGVTEGKTVLIAPGGGGIAAEGLYRHLGRGAALSLKVIVVDTRPQFSDAAMDRRGEGVRSFLRTNAGLRHLDVATLADLPLPSGSIHSTVVGIEVHHLTRMARTRFLVEVHGLLTPGGTLRMLDFSMTAALQPVVQFLNGFVAVNSVFGYRGEFVEVEEMTRILESIGYETVRAREVKYDWVFSSEEEMVSYLCAVFGLTLVDQTDPKDVSALLQAVAPLRKAGDGMGDVRITWTATLYSAFKHMPAPQLPALELPKEQGGTTPARKVGAPHDGGSSIPPQAAPVAAPLVTSHGTPLAPPMRTPLTAPVAAPRVAPVAAATAVPLAVDEVVRQAERASATRGLPEVARTPQGMGEGGDDSRVFAKKHVPGLFDAPTYVAVPDTSKASDTVGTSLVRRTGPNADRHRGRRDERKKNKADHRNRDNDDDNIDTHDDPYAADRAADNLGGYADAMDGYPLQELEEYELMEEGFEYLFKANPFVDLGGPYAFAGCSSIVNSKGSPAYVIGYHFRSNGWRDATPTFSGLVKATTLMKAPISARIYCKGLRINSVPDCIVAAMTNPDGPLYDLRAAYCPIRKPVDVVIDAFAAARKPLPDGFRFIEAALPWEAGDKAGLFVKSLQSASATVQEAALRHMPRSYLVALPCKGKTDDQWDYWLDDYFRGNPAAAAEYRKEWETRTDVSAVSQWRVPQPSLDLGSNLWISKPCVSLDHDPQRDLRATLAPMHEGKDVDVVYTPQHFLDLMTKPNACQSPFRIMQKYVEQPLLWGDYKADFRIFVATFSLSPPVYYIYTLQAPVRVGRDPYTEKRKKGTAHHVTNLSKSTREDGGDVMATWDGFITYLQEQMPGRDVEEEIFAKCAEMVRETLTLVPVTQASRTSLATSLSGWDVILDRDLNPWLMEINRYPDWRVTLSALSSFKYLLWAQYLDLSMNYGPGNYPDRVGGFVRVPVS